MDATCIVRAVRPDETDRLVGVVAGRWGSRMIASHDELYDVADLACFVAEEAGEWRGIAAYRVDERGCELVLLDAFERYRGTGTALLDAVADRALRGGARRLWLMTTNDNVDALRFYQRRGFTLCGLFPGAIERARERKPEIPLVGEHGIPIRDALELERWLDGDRTSQARTREDS